MELYNRPSSIIVHHRPSSSIIVHHRHSKVKPKSWNELGRNSPAVAVISGQNSHNLVPSRLAATKTTPTKHTGILIHFVVKRFSDSDPDCIFDSNTATVEVPASSIRRRRRRRRCPIRCDGRMHRLEAKHTLMCLSWLIC